MSSNLRFVFLTCALLLAGSTLYAATPQVWLERMSDAVAGRDYHGTLVYMQPGMAETFHVYHRMENGISTERIVALDGDGSEIIKTRDEVICIFPAEQRVVVDRRRSVTGKQNPLRALVPGYSPEINTSYELQQMAAGRLVGRSVVTIAIIPRDGFRYGYRIWLDESSAMPLKIQLIDQNESMPIEELFFTAISLPDSLDAEQMQPSVKTDGYVWVRHGQQQVGLTTTAGEILWEAAVVPAGFMQTAATLEHMAGAQSPRTHLVYSDGLASVSVFIDLADGAAEQSEGLARMGAANAYTLMRDGRLVTAMGEVPAETVHLIATSVQQIAE